MKKNTDNKLRICLAASAGGHMSQLLALKDGWKGHSTFYVTTTEVLKSKLESLAKVYFVGESNRQNLPKVIRVFLRCVNIIRQERPDVIVSTGAAAGCIICFLGKIFGAKVIWVDSITNVEKLSLSGWMVQHIADLCIVQWPELPKRYRKAKYIGSVV